MIELLIVCYLCRSLITSCKRPEEKLEYFVNINTGIKFDYKQNHKKIQHVQVLVDFSKTLVNFVFL